MNHFYVLDSLLDEVSSVSDLVRSCNVTWGILVEKGVIANVSRTLNFNDRNRLCENPCITWDIVLANPDINWSYSHLSSNPNITWDIIQNNPDKSWNFSMISSNPNITWDIIQNNPDKSWNFSMMSSNPNITWDIVKKYPNLPWDFYHMSANPNITWDIVLANLEEKWEYYMLSEHPNITLDIILSKEWIEYFADRFVYYSVVNLNSNPNITLKMIRENIHLLKSRGYIYRNRTNVNMSWRDVMTIDCSDLGYDDRLSNINFGRWNASSKIQHVYKRWSRIVKYELLTHTLDRKDTLGYILPYEITLYIINYTMEN
jgi:hypothetical protein